MKMRFAVCQLGARMHYAVPRLLHAAGQLERFYTDICASKGWPRLLRAIPPAWQPPAVRRLLGRVPQDLPAARIVAFTSFGLDYQRRFRAARTATEAVAAHLWAGRTFGRLILETGLRDAEGVYAFNSAALEVLTHARARGLRTVLEVTTAPARVESRLLAGEFAAHPDWEPAAAANAHEAELIEREEAEWNQADVILCGSDFVRRGIEECGGPAGRCVVVPYGVALPSGLPERGPRTGPLRVLTVGAVGLRKGSPSVFAAAQRLRGDAVFRMVGTTASLAPNAVEALRAEVDLRGIVPRAEMGAHYSWADVFLLPSVCEGSATVTYEALAAGLPVIATPNTGAHLDEGRSGFTVPIGNAEAIAAKLALLHENRSLLREMSEHARQQSQDLSLAAYGRRLLEAVSRDIA